jgi:LuxR family transcriptional regulator, maltose regulon positive regulatory protein
MPETILTTKLYKPPMRSENIIERPALFHAMDAGIRQKLTLISAPAGFGKSTLASSWLAFRGKKAAWVSLDAGDNDPASFWQYVLAGLQSIEPGLGQEAEQIIRSPQVHDPQPALINILNEFSIYSQEFLLVLDDYHAIQSPAVHESFRFFLEHIPDTVHVVLVTRIDPPFSLGRLRADGELSEIRAADLQFSIKETGDFLRRVMNLDLSEQQITELEKLTEGWAVGLKLAGLSLQRQEEYASFIRAFTGSHKFILEYLTEEILHSLSESRRSFLLRTSILESFSAPLCDAVLKTTDSRSAIDELQSDNLFVVPLDFSGEWFRYHHLFSQLLQALLRRDFAAMIPELHLEAATWYRKNGQLSQAVEHAFRSGDLEEARDYVLNHWNDMLHTGGVTTVLKWVKQLPEEMVQTDIYLALANCWARHLTGQTLDMAPYVNYANAELERHLKQDLLTDEERGSVEAQVYLMQSALARSQGQFEHSVEYAEKAVNVVPPKIGFVVGPAWNLLGAARVSAGDIEGGIDAYKNGIEPAYTAKNYLSAFAAIFWGAVYQIKQGRLTQANSECQRAIERAATDGLSGFPAIGLLYITQAMIALERNQLDQAKSLVARGGGFSEALRYGRFIRAHLHLALGDLINASALMQEVERIVLSTGEPYAIAEMHCEWAKLHIQSGNTAGVKASFRAVQQVDRSQFEHPLLRFSSDWLAAYINWKEDQLQPALEIIDCAIQRGRSSNSSGEILRFLILRSLILSALNQAETSRSVLREALELGSSEGYLRLWLTPGPCILPLLRKLPGEFAPLSPLGIYLEEIISLGEHTFGGEDEQNEKPSLLTVREMDVLRLICQGLSNPQIAEALVVTLNTVKKHTSNIYSKLDVASRTQAIARARELELC